MPRKAADKAEAVEEVVEEVTDEVVEETTEETTEEVAEVELNEDGNPIGVAVDPEAVRLAINAQRQAQAKAIRDGK